MGATLQQPRSGNRFCKAVCSTASSSKGRCSAANNLTAFDLFLREGGIGKAAWSKLPAGERADFQRRARACKASERKSSRPSVGAPASAAKRRRLLSAISRAGQVPEARVREDFVAR